jgi:hypothetical protein
MVSSLPDIARLTELDTSFEEVVKEITFRPFLVAVPVVTVPVLELKVMLAVPLFTHAVTFEPDAVMVDVSDASNQ